MKFPLIAVAAALGAIPAWAADPLYEEGLSARVGAMFSTADTRLRLDAANGALGTTITLEDNLFNRNFALGAGYAVYDYNLDVNKSSSRGSFDYQFAGPILYLNAGF